MPSTKLSVRTTDLGVAQALSDALEAAEPPLDAVTLFEDGSGAWRIEAYSQSRADAEAAAKALRADKTTPVANIALEELPDLNWVAISQAALPPVIAGRFVVHGTHDRGRIPYGPRAILIDAGEAFGTAHHGTTLGCLRAIDQLARNGGIKRVLDLGCGSGVLAIAAARALPRAQVMASDNDPIAVEVARANADALARTMRKPDGGYRLKAMVCIRRFAPDCTGGQGSIVIDQTVDGAANAWAQHLNTALSERLLRRH